MRATQRDEAEENDWILLDETDFKDYERYEQEPNSAASSRASKTSKTHKGQQLPATEANSSRFLFFVAPTKQVHTSSAQMALDANDIELIRASWMPARKDPSGSGALLFKGLFTKFPDYLKFFPQFSELDIENLHENKRLLKHAVKVIDTVTFVVDSIGDQTKVGQLNEALIQLVRSHLKRKIGLKEFRNLGIVIIDFICDLQQRRGSPTRLSRSNSPCENASLESMASSAETETHEDSCTRCQNYNHTHNSNSSANHRHQQSIGSNDSCQSEESSPTPPNLDTSLLVAAWTKLYAGILDVVKREGGED